jgi:tetratricopeptide (TPR) repeat protein
MSAPVPAEGLILNFYPGVEGRAASVHAVTPEGTSLAEGPIALSAAGRFRSRFGASLPRFVREALPPGELAAAGDALAALLPLEVREAVEHRLGQNPPLSLWICAHGAPFKELPWELLRCRFPDGEFRHLVRAGVGIIRRSDTPPPAAPALRRGRPKVLVAWADPRSSAYGPLPHLRDEVAHVLKLLRAYGEDAIAVQELPDATPAALQRRVREDPPDLLHWAGHSDLRPSGGVLILQGERPGEAASLYADELAGWMSAAPPRLVLLSSCLSGGPSAIAEALGATGVGAVLGMQFPVRDESARDFARHFLGALFRTGDVAEALAAGRSIGDPGQPDWAAPVLSLTGAETSVFAPLTEPSTVRIPTSIPYRRSPTFVGRDVELEQIHGALAAPDAAPVALVGLGGIGKTQLAVEYAHRYRPFYPGGVFWVHAQDHARLVEDMAALGRFWDLAETPSPLQKAELVRDALQDETHPCLLIVDHIGPEVTLDLLPAVGPCRVLVTCREQYLAPSGSARVVPERLPDEQGLTLLCGGQPRLTAEERRAAREIVRILGGLPLALVLAKHHLERLETSLPEYRDRLAGNRVAVLEQARRRFVTDTRHDGGLFDAIDLSCRTLSPPALDLLRSAACFAGRRINVELLDRAWGLNDRPLFEECVAELKDTCLISREEQGRLGMHELVRVYALGQLPEVERCGVLENSAGVLLQELVSANTSLDWKRVRPELAHCRAMVELCRENDIPSRVPLLRGLGEYALQQRDNDSAAEHFAEAIEALRARGEERTADTASLMMQLGVVEQHRRRTEEAARLVRRAAALGEEALSPEDPLLPELFNALGYVLKMQGLLDEAESWYARALELNRSIRGPGHPEVASCVNNLGALQEARGEYQAAYALYSDALGIDREHFGENHVKTGIRLANIGRVLVHLGRAPEAVESLSRTVEIYESEYGRQHVYTAMVLGQQGHAHRSLGERPEALRLYQEALPVLERYYGRDHYVCLDLRAAAAEINP